MSSLRLKDSQLSGTCLLSVDAGLLLDNWNSFQLGGVLAADYWSMLVASKDAEATGALLTTLLDALGNECRADKQLWLRYLKHCKGHATGKAVNLGLLGRQIDWLERFKPEDMVISGQLRLAWLTVKLAGANHFGNTEINWLSELEELGDRLYVEDAPLVCHADLHRAVQETNRFHFNHASDILDRWRDCDPAIPGLVYWGQVQSSLGQHAAFLGDLDGAVIYFDKALAAFAGLYDGGVRDCTQTRTYKIIAMMDNDSCTDKEIIDEFFKLSADLDFQRDILSGKAAKDKYIHHVLLRYLVNRGNQTIIEQYLAHPDGWLTGTGHPWPLIQAYRALLLYPHDPKRGLQTINDGAVLAFAANQGPTVQLIGACLRAISHGWGDKWLEYDKLLKSLEAELPHAENSIEKIREFIASPGDEREFISGVLPFNFR